MDSIINNNKRMIRIGGLLGIGKTHLVIELLNQEKIKDFFNEVLYIDCDGISNCKDISMLVSKNSPERKGLDDYLDIDNQNLLIVIDSLENIWQNDKKDLLHILRRISVKTNITLVVCIRGLSRPPIKWDKDINLGKLSDKDIGLIINSLSGTELALTKETSWLLELIDGLPLAAQLISYQIAISNDLDILHKRWLEIRSRLLELGEDYKQMSLHSTMIISYNNQAINETCKKILSLLSILPNGLTLSQISEIIPDNPYNNSMILQEHGLAYLAGDRLKVPAPIRNWLFDHENLENFDYEPLYEIYSKPFLSQEITISGNNSNWIDYLNQNYINLKNIILHFLTQYKNTGSSILSKSLSKILYFLTQYNGYQGGSITDLANYLYNYIDSLSEPETAYYSLADEYKRMGNLKEAERLYKISMQYENDINKADCSRNLSIIYKSQGSYYEYNQYINLAIDSYRKAGDYLGLANSLNNLSDFRYSERDYISAKSYAKQAIVYYKKINYNHGIANSIITLSSIHLISGSLIKARYCIDYALFIYRNTKDLMGIGICYSILGDYHRHNKNYNEALKYYKKAIDKFTNINDKINLADCYIYISYVYINVNDYREAELNLNRAKSILTEAGDHRSLAIIYYTLGFSYFNKGLYTESSKYLNMSLKINKKYGGIVNIDNCNQLLNIIEQFYKNIQI